MVIPAAYIRAMAVSIAVGMPAATQNAVLVFKNKNNNVTTRPRPMSPLSSSIFSRLDIVSARVRINSNLVPSGSVASKSLAIVSTLCWISIASPCWFRSTRMLMAGSLPTK